MMRASAIQQAKLRHNLCVALLAGGRPSAAATQRAMQLLARSYSSLPTPQQDQTLGRLLDRVRQAIRTGALNVQEVLRFASNLPKGFEHFGGEKPSKPEPSSGGSGGEPEQDPKKDENDSKQKPSDFEKSEQSSSTNQNGAADSSSEKKEETKEESKDKKEEKKESDDKKAHEEDPLSKRRTSRFSGARDKEAGNKPPGRDDEKEPDPDISRLFMGIGAVFLIMSGWAWWSDGAHSGQLGQEIDYTKFIELLANDRVERVLVVNKRVAKVFVRESGATRSTTSRAVPSDSMVDRRSSFYFVIGSIDSFETKLEAFQRDMDLDPRDFVPINYVERSSAVANVASMISASIIPLVLVGTTLYMLKSGPGAMGGGMGGRMSQIGKSGATMSKGGKEKTRFADVAGLDEAKLEVMEFVQFLKDPTRFTRLGAKIPKGALLVGPPGTGKTLLAKAVAGESNVPFFSISGSDFIEMFVGVGPSRVRDLFKDARKHAPCIVFIDEIDAVGRARGKGGFSGGNDERENTLNQMLVEMDGFNSREGIVVLAGTNRADILDKALLRPGRFDRQIYVDRPDIKGRAQIFMIHLKNITLKDKPERVAERMASLTPGMVGADIANVCNEAAIVAARANKDSVELADFEKALDRVIGGLEKKNKIMTDEERRIIAYHEAGHAIAGWFLEHADPLLKVTIIPRANALGFAQYLPKELSLYNPSQLLDRMCMTLAGRAAEQVFFGKVSTGAADDLKKVSQLAYSQVAIYGFNPKIGNVSFQEDREQSFTKPYSEQTANTIDEEVRTLVAAAYERTLNLLTERKEECTKLAELLLSKETINVDDVVRLIGRRPFAYQGVPGAEYLKDSHTEQPTEQPKPENEAGTTPQPAL